MVLSVEIQFNPGFNQINVFCSFRRFPYVFNSNVKFQLKFVNASSINFVLTMISFHSVCDFELFIFFGIECECVYQSLHTFSSIEKYLHTFWRLQKICAREISDFPFASIWRYVYMLYIFSVVVVNVVALREMLFVIIFMCAFMFACI